MNPTESIDLLVADGIVDSVVQRVKTGKEAEVFIVRKGEEYFAAKVYKERTERNFKNNVDYREGRSVRSTRDMRAMAKGTRYGKDMAEADWRSTEHDALQIATAAGIRVPKPDILYEGVLLMELVLGPDGQPAPRLIDVPLSSEQAIAMHREVVGQIVGLLVCDLIHGDLSPYNVLLAWNGPTVIDLPQVIKAAHNTQAEKFLVRDVKNVTDHFARYAPELKRRVDDGYAIWRRYMRRDLTPDYFPDESESAAVHEQQLKKLEQRAASPRPQPRQHRSHGAQGHPQAQRPPPVPPNPQPPKHPPAAANHAANHAGNHAGNHAPNHPPRPQHHAAQPHRNGAPQQPRHPQNHGARPAQAPPASANRPNHPRPQGQPTQPSGASPPSRFNNPRRNRPR